MARKTSSTSRVCSLSSPPASSSASAFACTCRALAHLELGEMEAVGLDLPDQMLYSAERVALRPGVRERLLHRAQIGEELFRNVVGAG